MQVSEDIYPSRAYELIQNSQDKPDFIILDVRTSGEFAVQRFDNAIHLDFFFESFKNELNKLDKNKTYLVYCKIGVRSGETIKMMKELGFREAYNLAGGTVLWEEEGMPALKVHSEDYHLKTLNLNACLPETCKIDDLGCGCSCTKNVV